MIVLGLLGLCGGVFPVLSFVALAAGIVVKLGRVTRPRAERQRQLAA